LNGESDFDEILYFTVNSNTFDNYMCANSAKLLEGVFSWALIFDRSSN